MTAKIPTVPSTLDEIRATVQARYGAAAQLVPFEPRHGMFNLDLNADGHVLGVEIIGARTHLPPALLQAILAHETQTKNTE